MKYTIRSSPSKYTQEGDSVRVKVNNQVCENLAFLIDKEDLQIVKMHSWHVFHKSICALIDGKQVKLKKIITGHSSGKVIHKNGDWLDFRKSELVPYENAIDTDKRERMNGYIRSISWSEVIGKYCAFVTTDNINYTFVGANGDFEEAQCMARDYYKEKIREERERQIEAEVNHPLNDPKVIEAMNTAILNNLTAYLKKHGMMVDDS